MVHPQLAETAAVSPTRGGRPILLRFAWFLTAGLGALLFLASILAAISQLGMLTLLEQQTNAVAGILVYQPDALEFWLDLATLLLGLIVSAAYLLVSLVLFLRKGDEPPALLFAIFLLLVGVLMTGPFQNLTSTRADLFQESEILLVILFQAFWCFFFVFPDGQFVPRWTRWLGFAFPSWVLATIVLSPVVLPRDQPAPAQVVFLFFWYLTFPLCGVAAQIYRYRQVSNRAQQQQTKWVVLAFSLMICTFLVVPIVLSLPVVNPAMANASAAVIGMRLWNSLYLLLLSFLPLSMGVAILRYHLWDIDVILNRALVYGSLTALVLGIYILLVGGLGILFESSGGMLIALLATAVVAVLFQPLRERVQRGVNRLLYGERDDPYAVLAQLGQRLEATLAPDAVLPTLVESVAQTLKLPYAAIQWRDAEQGLRVEWGRVVSPSSILVTFPLLYQHESVGQLVVAVRSGDETLSAQDRRLLETIANQAALAVHAVRLTTDLQRSRERLITAREEERRRMRRDLHDGLGPALASITLKLDAARNLLPPNAEASERLLTELKTQTRNAIADIRRLVYALRPPALDELGLVGALREFAARSQSNELEISLQVTEPLPTLSAAVEVAAYRIATEALTNVQRHAHARHCQIRLEGNEDLRLEIKDDGAGLPEGYQAGVGLTSMRERAAELGGMCLIENAAEGGARVKAQLPTG